MLRSFLNKVSEIPLKMRIFASFATVFFAASIVIGLTIHSLVNSTVEKAMIEELERTTNSVFESVDINVKSTLKSHLSTIAGIIQAEEQKNSSLSRDQDPEAILREIEFNLNKYKISSIELTIIWSKLNKRVFYHNKNTAISNRDINFIVQHIPEADNNGYFEFGHPQGLDKNTGIYFFEIPNTNFKAGIIFLKKDLANLIDLTAFRKSISSLKFAQTGYAFIYNSNCEVVAHPKLPLGKVLDILPPESKRSLQKGCANKNGLLRYLWKNPGENVYREKIAIHKFNEDYDWIVGASIYTDEIYAPLKKIRVIVIAVFLVGIFIIFFISYKISSNISADLLRAELINKENAKLFAIAQTTQMLAHDVRKPFSILKMGLEMFSSIQSVEELKETLRTFTPEVEKAMTSVNGMINDVMEIGRTAKPQSEHVTVTSLIESSLTEVCRIQQDANIEIKYDLNHTHMLNVDPQKTVRVFSNILGNAMQAMNGVGTISIKTSEANGMVTFCLVNTGSFITQEDLPNLFDAFFTKNKKGGTGLGLAIAKKVVTSHGGWIWCESSESEKTVAFYFTLPASLEKVDNSATKLPEKTKNIIEQYIKSLERSGFSGEMSTHHGAMKEYEINIMSYIKKLDRCLKIAILDDEAVYRNALVGLFQKNEKIKDSIDISLFNNAGEALSAFFSTDFDFFICDVDLGSNRVTGFDIVKTLRDRNTDTAICIHSNRSLPEDYSRSVEVGADAFLPKPLTQVHLLKFMSDSVVHKQTKKSENEGTTSLGSDAVGAEKPLIAYIEDDAIFRRFAPRMISDAEIIVFDTPEQFILRLEKESSFGQSLDLILTDQNFDRFSDMTGIELGEILKQKFAVDTPIILFSNDQFSEEELKDRVNLFIPKQFVPFSEMMKMLP